MPDDSALLDWLESDDSRLQDVYWRIQNEGINVRDAILWLMENQE